MISRLKDALVGLNDYTQYKLELILKNGFKAFKGIVLKKKIFTKTISLLLAVTRKSISQTLMTCNSI
jgi:hypothetical protein